MYFTDNATDSIFYMKDVWTEDGGFTTTTVRVADAAQGLSFADGRSFVGITFDGQSVYAGSQINDTSGISSYIKITPDVMTSPTAWTIERQDVYGSYGGPCAVGAGVLALPDMQNGEVTIFNWTAGGLNQVGSPIAGSGKFTTNLAYDEDAGKIYAVSTGDAGTVSTGQVNVFNYNKTTKALTYPAPNQPYMPALSTTFDRTIRGIQYHQIAINATDNVLAVPRSTGSAATAGVALVDSTQPGPNATSYALLNYVPPLATATANSKTGITFGTRDGLKFLLATDGVNKGYVYGQPPAAVADWTIY